MNVIDIINHSSVFLTGISEPSQEERLQYLNCLNEAHFELWDIATDYYNYDFITNRTFGDNDNVSLQWNDGGLYIEDCKKVYDAWLEVPGDVKRVSYKDYLTDYVKNNVIIIGSKPKVYTVLDKAKFFLIYLAPLPQKPYRQSLRVQYSKIPLEFFLYTQEDEIPYPIQVIQKLVLGTCSKGIMANLGSANKNELSYYTASWEQFKSEFRQKCYAESIKNYKPRNFSYV